MHPFNTARHGYRLIPIVMILYVYRICIIIKCDQQRKIHLKNKGKFYILHFIYNLIVLVTFTWGKTVLQFIKLSSLYGLLSHMLIYMLGSFLQIPISIHSGYSLFVYESFRNMYFYGIEIYITAYYYHLRKNRID